MKPALLYFTWTFAAGFALGVLRTLFAVPLLGERKAELSEMPLMILVSYFAARHVLQRCAVPPDSATRLRMGLAALTLMLAAEFGAVLGLRGLTITGYLAARDPVAGAAYVIALAIFAAMPWLLRRR